MFRTLEDGLTDIVPCTYSGGSGVTDKLWWVRAGSRPPEEYFMCLLLFDEHCMGVTHFKPKLWYVSILDGKDKSDIDASP